MKVDQMPTPAQPPQAHLTDDEIDELLLEDTSAQSHHHLAACQDCSARVDEFRSSMELFNQASLAWSARRSNTLPSQLPVQCSSRIFATPSGALSFVATFCVGVAVAITAGLHQRSDGLQTASGGASQTQVGGSLRAVAPDTREQEIDQDNAMLREIHLELDRPEPSPLAFYPTSPR